MNRTKKKIIIASAVLTVGLAAMLVRCSCTNQELTVVKKNKVQVYEEKPFINPFSSSLDIPFAEFDLRTGVDTVLKFQSGTRISIPACAFSSSGKKEKVKLYYREVMDRAGMISTGIPMRVRQGTDDALETTGMMEIRVKKEGKELMMNGECPIKLEMVNCMEGKDVNLYYLDEGKKEWITKKENLPVMTSGVQEEKKIRKKYPEPDYTKMAKDAAYFVPVKPKVADPYRFGFQFKLNLQQYPEVNVYDGIIWEYAGKAGGVEDPQKHSWVQKAFWKEMVLDKTDSKGIYRLRLTSGDKSFTTLVRPVFDQEDLEYANDVFNYRYEKYRKFVENKKEEHRQWVKKQEEMARQKELERKRVAVVSASESLIFRSFQIDQLGIWNCDRFLQSQNPVVVMLELNLKDENEKAERVYLIDKENNSVLYYYAHDGKIQHFKFDSGKKYDFLVLGNQGSIYKLKSSEANQLSTAKGGIVSFKLKQPGVQVKNLEELRSLI